ncbi:unnamed protein product [Microthlaspi erraticum]|uniref:RRM domain-containing protein n=1 Tax=Microthlaspi erraticum TaxID=1685480 RepID=A0A6D2J443_9BRAS|nr:unnamed protein product [Microthlaspi erraticum]
MQLDINNERTLFVKGFDRSHNKDDIKSALIEHFAPCGEITRVYVPYACTTGASIGYAFIDISNDNGKALTLDGSYMGDRKLKVVKGTLRPEFNCYVGYPNCPHYLRYINDMVNKSFRERHRGRLRRLTQDLQDPSGRV